MLKERFKKLHCFIHLPTSELKAKVYFLSGKTTKHSIPKSKTSLLMKQIDL